MSDKPRSEFWDTAKGFIGWCQPEELRVLRLLAGKELEERLKQWSQKIEVSPESKARKNKAIKRNISKVKT